MNIIKDTEYNEKYLERPKRYKIEDGEFGPIYFTEDCVSIHIIHAETELANWNEIKEIVDNLNKVEN